MLGVLNTALLDLLDLVVRVRLYILALLEETFQQYISEKYQVHSIFSMNTQHQSCSGQDPLWKSITTSCEARLVMQPPYWGHLLCYYYGVPEHVLLSRRIVVIIRSVLLAVCQIIKLLFTIVESEEYFVA